MNYSIIIPMRNAEKYIEECLQSVIAQTYKDVEIIIVDDFSEDNSIKYAKQMLSGSKLNYKILVNSKRRGVSYTRNRGIAESIGENIVFIDADDCIEPELIERIDEGMKQFDYVFCNFDRITEKNVQIGGVKPAELYTETPETYIVNRGKVWGCGLKRSIIVKYDISFDEELDYKEDHLFMAEYISHVNTIGIIKTNAYHYRITPGSLVQSNGNHKYNADRSIAALKGVVGKLTDSEARCNAIIVNVTRMFLNDAWMEWYKTDFDVSVNYELLYECINKFKVSYIIQSKVSIKTTVKELFLRLPFFRCKVVWKILFMCKERNIYRK
ncbi:MAG: glycosyltransferase family A protein [Oliverpabstia sp.]|nr:glycosyltransferase family A protein [Oliverpabstia sp.]